MSSISFSVKPNRRPEAVATSRDTRREREQVRGGTPLIGPAETVKTVGYFQAPAEPASNCTTVGSAELDLSHVALASSYWDMENCTSTAVASSDEFFASSISSNTRISLPPI